MIVIELEDPVRAFANLPQYMIYFNKEQFEDVKDYLYQSFGPWHILEELK